MAKSTEHLLQSGNGASEASYRLGMVSRTPELTVALCDDDPMMRSALESYVRTARGITCVGAYASGRELLRGVAGRHIDVVLLDVRMPDGDGPTTLRRLLSLREPPRVLYLTSYAGEVPLADVLEGRAVGALSKDLTPADLVRAIRTAAAGNATISAEVIAAQPPLPTPPLQAGTLVRDERQAQVLDLVCQGLSNAEIAERTSRSLSSVKQILADLMRCADVPSRAALIACALGHTPGPADRTHPQLTGNGDRHHPPAT